MNKTSKYVNGKVASSILGVHQRTLYQWDEKEFIDTIRTPWNKRLDNVNKYLCENGKKDLNCNINIFDDFDNNDDRVNISYVRVSSKLQPDDLERQKSL